MTAAYELRELLTSREGTESLLRDGAQRHRVIACLVEVRQRFTSLLSLGDFGQTVALGEDFVNLEREAELCQ